MASEPQEWARSLRKMTRGKRRVSNNNFKKLYYLEDE